MTIWEKKQQLRSSIKKTRGQLSEEDCRCSDAGILTRMITLPEYRQANVIVCYVSMMGEVSTIQIMEDAWGQGKRVGVPLCTGQGVMEMRQINSLADLHPGYFGTQEPSADALLIRPEEIDFAIIPCVSCSRDGRRLGYGGGFYDRYLQQVEVVKAILCRENLMNEDIPAEIHDISMDIIITEQEVIRTDHMRCRK